MKSIRDKITYYLSAVRNVIKLDGGNVVSVTIFTSYSDEFRPTKVKG